MKLAREAEQEMKWELLGRRSRTQKGRNMYDTTARSFASNPLMVPHGATFNSQAPSAATDDPTLELGL